MRSKTFPRVIVIALVIVLVAGMMLTGFAAWIYPDVCGKIV